MTTRLDQVVTTVLVTVVHPDNYSPAEVREHVDNTLDRTPGSWGFGVRLGHSVKTALDSDEVPLWVLPEEVTK